MSGSVPIVSIRDHAPQGVISIEISTAATVRVSHQTCAQHTLHETADSEKDKVSDGDTEGAIRPPRDFSLGHWSRETR